MQLILKKKSPTILERTYDIDEGSTYTENYNETLDSANIRISHQLIQINIEPFDKCILHDENGNFPDKYMCVDSFTEVMESLDPYIYSYEISLFSETKELENVILPNLSITQRKNERKTILDYLSLYIYDLYGPKKRTNVDFESKYTFVTYHNNDENGEFFVDKFRVQCPEMQWNAPTLREVLTDLMMVVDCIPVLRNNKIDYIDLTEIKGSIDTTKVNYIQKSQSSEDYVSELKMNMVNVMQTSLNGVKQTVNRVEHLTFKAENDGYVVTDENYLLKTQFPILRIKHLWMYFQAMWYYVKNNDQKYFIKTYKVDLCNISLIGGGTKQVVYEKTEYNSLPLVRYNPSNFNTISQNIAIYYIRYSNEISGFTQLSKYAWIFDPKISTLNMLKELIAENCYDINGWDKEQTEGAINVQQDFFKGDLNNTVYFSTFFDIEYETTGDAVFKAGKDIAPTHERVVNDNQTFSFVDSYNQGFIEYQKANRLGNKQLFINARYENDFEDLIEIGQIYEDNIVFQTQYQFYKNHIEVNAIATKNYVLRDYFTGVKAKIRAWNYAPADESFTRHDLEKYYLEFSKSQKLEKDTFNWSMSYFLTPLIPTYIRPLKYAFVRTDDGVIEYPDSTNYYAIDLLGRIVGNSIVFTFGFDDNFTVTKRVSHELQSSNIDANYVGSSSRHLLRIRKDFIDDYGGIPLEDTKYVDGYGEFQDLTYYLTYTMDDPDILYDIEPGEYITDGNDSSKFFLYRVCQLPLVAESLFSSYDKISGTRVVYKDNKEIPKLSLQYEFCSDTHDIIFTKKFLQLQECIRELTSEEQQIQHLSFTQTASTSDWIQTGGTQTVTTPNPSSITGIAGEGYAGTYSFSVPSLVGKLLSSYSIVGGIPGRSNTVSFNSSTGTFSGTTYSTSNVPASFHAIISYVVYGQETAYWIYSEQYYSPSLINQQVQNIVFSGFTPTGNDEARCTFNSSTGTFTIYIKTYTQPVSTLNLTVTYDLILQSGTYVANTYKIYQANIDTLDWRNPSLSGANEVIGASLSFTYYTTSSKITINGVSNHTEHVYYITDNSNNILLAVAGTNIFYLNVLLSRDYNIYGANGEIIGSI